MLKDSPLPSGALEVAKVAHGPLAPGPASWGPESNVFGPEAQARRRSEKGHAGHLAPDGAPVSAGQLKVQGLRTEAFMQDVVCL